MAKQFRVTLVRPFGWGNAYATHFIPPKRADNQRGYHNRTGYRGVWEKGNKFRACLSSGGKTIHLGYFDTAEEAARAYDQGAREYHGADAIYNFAYEQAENREGEHLRDSRERAR